MAKRPAPASTNDDRAAQPPLPWNAHLRAIVSLLLALHVTALFVAPWSMPPPASQLSGVFARWFAPYMHTVFIYHGYRFFAPIPGPSHIVMYELTFDDGHVEKGQTPDLEKHWPRLLYHRHFMLSERVYEMTDVPPEPAPPSPDLPPRIQRQARSEYQQALRYYQGAIERRELLLRPFARRLLAETGARKVRLWAVQHELLAPEQVLSGMSPTEEGTYTKRDLGEFHRGTP